MIQKFREYFTNNPNSSLFSALICSLTAMTTDELVAIIGALGLLISTVWGLIQKSVTAYNNHKENVEQKAHDREMERMDKINASERYRVETEQIRISLQLVKDPIKLTPNPK